MSQVSASGSLNSPGAEKSFSLVVSFLATESVSVSLTINSTDLLAAATAMEVLLNSIPKEAQLTLEVRDVLTQNQRSTLT